MRFNGITARLGNGQRDEERSMSTLHRIREFAFVATVAAGVLVASATSACDERVTERSNIVLIADLGHMTVIARRDAEVADLGSLTVTAQRLSDTDSGFADLGAMTVTAPRAGARVADLGGITVTATRIQTVTVATRNSKRSWE
jgi:hypothetical protein